MTDIEAIRRMVEPFARLAGVFHGRVMALITEPNMKRAYQQFGGTEKIRAVFKEAGEAIVRIGEQQPEGPR